MSSRSEPVIYVSLLRADKSPEALAEASAVLTNRVLALEYQDSEKKTDVCKITLNNHDLTLFDSGLFEKGTLLEVSWGYLGNMSPPRRVSVTKVTGSLDLTIEAQDQGCLLHKVKRTVTYENMTRSAAVKQVAADNGFDQEAFLFIDDTEVVFPSIQQTAMTDAQFLKKLADLEGFEFYVDFDGFHWHRRRTGQRPLRAFTYYLPPDVGDIVSFAVDNDVTAKPGKVTVVGRSSLDKKDITQSADATTTARTTTATQAELTNKPAPVTAVLKVDPRTGETSTVYPAAATPPLTNPGSSEVRPSNVKSDAEAKREAAGVFTRTQQTAVQLTLNIVGDPAMLAKSIVSVAGLGQRLSGNYYLTEVTHKIGSSGYTCTLKGKSDGTNKGSGGLGKGKPNTKEAPKPVGPAPLQPTLVVDPRTGETSTVYKDVGGREPPKPGTT